jgi:hypothetical protein
MKGDETNKSHTGGSEESSDIECVTHGPNLELDWNQWADLPAQTGKA